MNVSPVPAKLPDIPPHLLGDGEKYHCFISHCSEDVQVSRKLKEDLEGLGLKCFDSDDFQAGADIVTNITRGVAESRRMLILVSRHMLSSSWVTFEIANARNKAQNQGEVTFIPILCDIQPQQVPAYIKEMKYIEASDDHFWPKLLQMITESTPMKEAIPVGNIAHAFAWSYYYGWLSFMLPGLHQRCLEQAQNGDANIRFFPKFLIILPQSCDCPANPKDVDKNVELTEIEIKYKATRAGKMLRPYNNSVYKVTDPDTGEAFYAVMEFATPLMSLYEMEQGRVADIDHPEKTRQMKLFQQKVRDILEQSKECRGKAVCVEWRDHSWTEKAERLSKVLVSKIREELSRDQQA